MTSRIAVALLASSLPLTAVASEKPKAPPPKDVEAKIADLSKQRETWIAAHATPTHDSFDASVMTDVKTQAKAKGLAL